MLKKALLLGTVAAVTGCSNNGAPSETQVKQALYDYYATAGGRADLNQALDKEVSVKNCRPDGPGYRCTIQNQSLGSTIDMLFVFDKGGSKWKFQREAS